MAEVWNHPDIVDYGRSIVVMETNNTKLERYFIKVAKELREKYTGVLVTMKDPEHDLENPNYDNCYVVGPNGFIMRYFISKHDMVIDDVAENDIRGVFGISSLPKALALRNQIIDSP